MPPPVHILGIGAEGVEGLSARARTALDSATFVAGGTRHLAMIGPREAKPFPITNNLGDLVRRLRRRGPRARWVVLASGDPLFFGIGHRLGEDIGRDQIIVEPAVSSMQLAFARAGVAWHDAEIASVHGRPLEKTLRPLLFRPKIGLFTQDGSGPSAIAEFFARHGLGGDDYTAHVGENLGAADEQVTTRPLDDLIGRRFADLNIVILLRRDVEGRCPVGLPGYGNFSSLGRPTGIPDDLFVRPDDGPVLLTHSDVRVIVGSRFRRMPEGPIWDIGAGLGGVSAELAHAFPEVEVVAVERSRREIDCLRRNRLRCLALNIRIVEGTAPDCLADEEAPAGVFLGGTGGRLDATLDLIFHRLIPRGVVVANFVGLENLARFLERVRGEGWGSDVTQVQISHGEPLAGLTTFVPLRPVWVASATRPGS